MGKVKKKFAPSKSKSNSPEASSLSEPPLPVHVEPLSSKDSTEEMDANANELYETLPTSENAIDLNPTETIDSSKVSLSTRFLITKSTDFSSSIEALLAIEKEYPSLQVSTKITSQGDYILQAKDKETLTLLQNIKVLNSGKTVNLTTYYSSPKKTKRVLEGYPLGFPMDRLENHPLIESASRLKVWSTKEETRQVLVTIIGEPPKEIKLGIFGTFSLREYYHEPLRCSKCQRFDHHVSKCRSNPRCGVCSEAHLTEICINKIKAGTRPPAKCPNCNMGHHAWNPYCRERRKRLNLPTEESTSKPLNRFNNRTPKQPSRTNAPKFSSIPTNLGRSYASAVSTTEDSPNPSVASPSFQSIPINNDNENSNQNIEFLSTILQMGLIFVGKHIDKHIVKDVVASVLTMSKDTPTSIKNFLITPNRETLQPSDVSTRDAPTSTGNRNQEEELTNEPSNISKDEFMELNSDPLSQRKRTRRSSSGSDSDSSDLPQKYITKEIPLTEISIPQVNEAQFIPSQDGSPPVIHIPEQDADTANKTILDNRKDTPYKSGKQTQYV